MDQNRDQTPAPRRFAGRRRQRLALGGLAASAAVALTGCDSTPDFQTAQFTTLSECTSAGFPSSVCQAGYNAAYLEHQRTAPKFASQEACEKEWGSGHCAPQIAGAGPDLSSAALAGVPAPSASAGSIFMPAIAGFLVSQALQQRYYDRGDIDIDYYGGYSSYRGSPIYRTRTGTPVTIGGGSGGKSVMTPVNVNTRTVAQNGFGGRSFSRSYSGGSSRSSFGG